MKSNVCKIEKGSKDLEAIFRESEKVAVYNDLNHKQTLQLRLLCEEIDGMLPNIIDDFDGDLWFEFEDGVCKIKISITLAMLTKNKKDEFIKIAKNKKNASVVGVVGKIRAAVEDFFLAEDDLQAYYIQMDTFRLATGYSEGVNYSYLWTLSQYKDVVKTEDKKEAWDELEKSVIASVADDVIVGVTGKTVEIVIVKSFA